ncbi:hypothetical protein NRB20_55630 [Nocardia sp. RB20]|uniref:Uncharacterized protein n=2 Tax=Nocardia macrotermitis TaxID=2585198 RepID=A0A7K0D9S6_9NOCA|nr:hypothetical protein [Nocardia macrotermitis]MQY22448.1 hypothetical protein [Nocardia macrotermitis]
MWLRRLLGLRSRRVWVEVDYDAKRDLVVLYVDGEGAGLSAWQVEGLIADLRAAASRRLNIPGMPV